MTDSASRVLSIRIDPELLEGVRKKARSEGRSVSGEIVFIIRNEIRGKGSPREKPRAISGWLAGRDVPETHGAFRAARTAASAALVRGVRRKARQV